MNALILRIFAIFVFMYLFAHVACAETEKQNTTLGNQNQSSVERQEILDAIKKEFIDPSGKEEYVFEIKCLKIKNQWAWIETEPRSAKKINGIYNHYEDLNVLLQKKEGGWKVMDARPCCGECADDPDCADDKRYFKKLREKFPSAPEEIFPTQ